MFLIITTIPLNGPTSYCILPMKPMCYVVPMEAALEVIRVASVELSLSIHPPLFSLWSIHHRSRPLGASFLRQAMSQPLVRGAVLEMEQQLFARLLRDIYLVTCENILQNESLYLLRHRLRHHHHINEETLFKSIFEEFLRFSDLPPNIRLGYNGRSLFLET